MTVIMTAFGKVFSVTRKGERNNGVYSVPKERARIYAKVNRNLRSHIIHLQTFTQEV